MCSLQAVPDLKVYRKPVVEYVSQALAVTRPLNVDEYAILVIESFRHFDFVATYLMVKGFITSQISHATTLFDAKEWHELAIMYFFVAIALEMVLSILLGVFQYCCGRRATVTTTTTNSNTNVRK